MDFVIVANAWGAGMDNPTSKHRIALELARRGHRVLWVEGAGMRAPSVGSGSDRSRMARKVLAALRGARRVKGGESRGKTVEGGRWEAEGDGGRVNSEQLTVNSEQWGADRARAQTVDHRPQTVDRRLKTAERGAATPIVQSPISNPQSPISHSQSIWILSPLFIPMPKFRLVRWLNGIVGAWSARAWCWLLGLKNPVLINYVPVLAEVMRRWPGRDRRQKTVDRRQKTVDRRPKTGDSCGLECGHAGCLDGAEPQGLRSTVYGLRSSAPARIVYHCVDRWDAFAMYDSAVMAEMDRRCCEYAQVVIASASELRDRCLRWNPNTHLVTHGVDYEHFRTAVDGGGWMVEGRGEERGQRPRLQNAVAAHDGRGETGEEKTADHRPRTADQGTEATPSVGCPASSVQRPLSTVHRSPFTVHSSPSGLPPGPVIGFFGLLSEWVSQPLLLRLAREIPGAHLVLIGKADVDVTPLKGVASIHLLGSRPFRDLPGYLAHFTVGIIPFVVNDLTRSVNPIKLREMLSGGCPVVSTALPEVRAMADCRLPVADYRSRTRNDEECRRKGVFVAEDDDEFVKMVAGLVERPLSIDERRAVSVGMAGETWAGKVDEMLRIIGEVSEQ